MQKRQPGPPAGAEIAAEAELHPGKEAVPDVPAQILSPGQHRRLVRREQAHQRLGKKLHRNDRDRSKPAGQADGPEQGLLRPLRLSSAEILRAQRGDRRQHRRRDEEQKADDLLHDPHSRRVV